MTSERFDFVFNRLLYSLPMLAKHFTLANRVPGAVHLNLADDGQVSGLAFCSNRPEFRLIPDPVFVSTLGYAKLRNKSHRPPFIGPTDSHKRSGAAQHPDADLARAEVGARTSGYSCARLDGCIPTDRCRDHMHCANNRHIVCREYPSLGLMRQRIEPEQFSRYKYQIDIDGNTSAWQGLYQKLLTGSPVIKIGSPFGYRQWSYDRLRPSENYIRST